ncbi:MAG TPA: hypothetical protein VLF62_01755, partial [Candidatus Saccharimonadales bacterium]|nr:hypothetical protein [Candidatus Saccharimonadales bacterium]
MAEDFPRYNHEDSDDDAPAERPQPAEHTLAPAEAEHPKVPAQQEGTIFSRDVIAPNLSRPLFDFIRKQEQPKAHLEENPEPLLSTAALPGVSNPSEPEMRTYQPPAETEIAHAIHEASSEDDDDDEAADDTSAAHATTATPMPTPAPAPERPAAHQQELERPLKEQFEEIMRAEMGEDYTRMASGEHLGETEDEPEPGDPRTFVANWPHQPSEYAEPEQPAQNEGEPDAFYYAEAEPQPDPQEPRPFNNGEAAAIAR